MLLPVLKFKALILQFHHIVSDSLAKLLKLSQLVGFLTFVIKKSLLKTFEINLVRFTLHLILN